MSKLAKWVCLINSLLTGHQSFFFFRLCCIYHKVNFPDLILSQGWDCCMLNSTIILGTRDLALSHLERAGHRLLEWPTVRILPCYLQYKLKDYGVPRKIKDKQETEKWKYNWKQKYYKYEKRSCCREKMKELERQPDRIIYFLKNT